MGVWSFVLLQGFRKVDTDRWEFANEDFLQGKQHLLRNIHRRKSSQIQQIGSYVGASVEISKSGSESEIEKLRRDKNLLWQELEKLQMEHHTTLNQMDAMNQRLQAAEQRQKQMVFFMAKVLQNPTFLDHIHKLKEQREIVATRGKRKFLKQLPANRNNLGLSKEGLIVKHKPDVENHVTYPVLQSLQHNVGKQRPDYLLRDMVEKLGLDTDTQIEVDNVASVNLGQEVMLDSLGSVFLDSDNILFEGKNVTSSQKDVMNASDMGYLVSFPEDLSQEKVCSDAVTQVDNSIIKHEEIWNMHFDTSPTHPTSFCHDIWGNLLDYNDPENEIAGGLSNFWDIESQQAGEGSGTDKLTDDDFTFSDFDTQVGHIKADCSKNIDP
eukprot:TRINITY_DN5349_c0_g1_i1.p1 TRINITY_DN5349_c0_g1~~TRINITY_DN5349_c0_g1_i1.p1  ORF type:complete len:381 (+),score=78.52 TRINITY_DN5349_c0_g1_i1:104-1246(+)